MDVCSKKQPDRNVLKVGFQTVFVMAHKVILCHRTNTTKLVY